MLVQSGNIQSTPSSLSVTIPVLKNREIVRVQLEIPLSFLKRKICITKLPAELRENPVVFSHNQIHSTISFISICRKIGCLQGPFLIRRKSKLIFPDNTTLKAWNNQLNNLQPLNRHTPCFIFSHKQNINTQCQQATG